MQNSKNQSEWPRRFKVKTEPNHVKRFMESVSRQPASLSEHDLDVPMTYVASWFGLPEVEAAILNSFGTSLDGGPRVLLQLEQSINLLGKLQIGQNYFLDIEESTPNSDGKFVVVSKVKDLENNPQVELRSTFIIFNTEHKSL